MKKGIMAAMGAVVLMGGLYGVNPAFAAENQPTTAPAQVKKADLKSQFKDEINQLDQLHQERLAIRSQILAKKSNVLALVAAAKNSKSKDKVKAAKTVKAQIESINKELKPLLEERKYDRSVLRAEIQKANGKAAFDKLISVNQKINEKLHAKNTQLDQLINALK